VGRCVHMLTLLEGLRRCGHAAGVVEASTKGRIGQVWTSVGICWRVLTCVAGVGMCKQVWVCAAGVAEAVRMGGSGQVWACAYMCGRCGELWAGAVGVAEAVRMGRCGHM
jgi:hypothetical protein